MDDSDTRSAKACWWSLQLVEAPTISLSLFRTFETCKSGFPSSVSSALPCCNTPPVQNDLVAKDAADRSSRNLGDSIVVFRGTDVKVQESGQGR